MVEIIPRWEWRMFAKQVEIAVDLQSCHRTRHVESSEVYLVSATSRANPKIRDEKIDIKILERIDENGLEQWKPVMKAGFPLSKDQVSAVYGALDLGSAVLDRDGWDLDAFLALIDGDGRAKIVHVNKVRNQYDVNGCTVEMSDVIFDGDSFKTVAVEDPRQNVVWDTVGLLGLRKWENFSYVKFIRRIKNLDLNPVSTTKVFGFRQQGYALADCTKAAFTGSLNKRWTVASDHMATAAGRSSSRMEILSEYEISPSSSSR